LTDYVYSGKWDMFLFWSFTICVKWESVWFEQISSLSYSYKWSNKGRDSEC